MTGYVELPVVYLLQDFFVYSYICSLKHWFVCHAFCLFVCLACMLLVRLLFCDVVHSCNSLLVHNVFCFSS